MILIDSPPAADTTFTIMTKIYLMPVVGEILSHFKSDEAIRRSVETPIETMKLIEDFWK
jgi:hypothetical protein